MTDESALEDFLNRQQPTPSDLLVSSARADSAAEILDEIGNISIDYRAGITRAAVDFVSDMQTKLELHRAGDPSSGWRVSQAQLIWLQSIHEKVENAG